MRIFGLIGYPLSHSFSPGYFKAKFLKEHIDADYRLFPIEDISRVPALIKECPLLSGLNITIPYKELVIPYLDFIDATASAVGAVNCIRVNKGKLEGFNTDVIGFHKSIAPLLQAHHTKALILGTGGASKAVGYILRQHNIECLYASRTSGSNSISYREIGREIIENYPVIINATPLGMYPAVSGKPAIPYEYITGRNLLYDLVYNPAETTFMKLGKEQGASVKNGYDMLLYQAEASWDIWNVISVM